MENDLINVAIVNVAGKDNLSAEDLNKSSDSHIVQNILKKYMSKRCKWCANPFSRDKKDSDERWDKKIFDTKYCIKRYNYVKDLYLDGKLRNFFYKSYHKTGYVKRCYICGEKNKVYASDEFYRSIKRKFCSDICLRKFHHMRRELMKGSLIYFDRLFNLEEEK